MNESDLLHLTVHPYASVSTASGSGYAPAGLADHRLHLPIDLRSRLVQRRTASHGLGWRRTQFKERTATRDSVNSSRQKIRQHSYATIRNVQKQPNEIVSWDLT